MMTTRDTFALHAMQIIMQWKISLPAESIARAAFDMADAMMAEKKRREAPPDLKATAE